MLLPILSLFLLLPSALALPPPLTPSLNIYRPFAPDIKISLPLNPTRSRALPATGRAGETLAACDDSSVCQGDGTCVSVPNLEDECTSADPVCLCFPLEFQYCWASSECPTGEICADTQQLLLGVCLSENISDHDYHHHVAPLHLHHHQ